MTRDRIFTGIRIAVLLPFFVTIVTIWVPFMLLKDVWKKSAKEVNDFFDNKGS